MAEEETIEIMSSEDTDSSEPAESSDDASSSEEESWSMETIRKQINNVLSNIQNSSAFSCGGTVKDAQNPGLGLNGHGSLRLPLSPDDAKAIISKARQSPFGKGSETIVDTSIRKSWQLDPSQFTIQNPNWEQQIDNILSDVRSGLDLGAGMKFSAELYKLLLYEEGAFFKPHKDSEKAPGMFGTLVICLPSEHQGGELILAFNRENKTIKTASDAYSYPQTSYAAWYADVLHEVKPVTSGYRLVLTYNLIRPLKEHSSRRITPLDKMANLIKPLKMYNRDLVEAGNTFPNFLVHRLAHQYTQASLRAELLKGEDLVQIQCLKEAANGLKFGLYLANMEKEVLKTDESYESYYSTEEEEELERNIVLRYVANLDGTRVDDFSQSSVPVDEEAILDHEVYDEEDPDEEEHTGHTGNEGCTASFWYRDTVSETPGTLGK